MKTLKIIFISLAIFLVSCKTSQETLVSKNYDETICKLSSKAQKRKLNDKQLNLLTDSYHQANEDDHQRIISLKKSGQPDIWIEIYQRLNNIKDRQDKIEILSEDIKKQINFKSLNLNNEISKSKEKAELYICAKVNSLLKSKDNHSINEAQSLVNQLYQINPNNKNIEDLRIQLAILPAERIFFRVATPIELHLPKDLAQNILDFDDNTIYGVPFDIVYNKNIKYDIMIRIMIDEKNISPEKIDAVTFEEKNNNFKAIVTDKTMSKSATIKGKIQIVDVKNDEILISTPYDVSSTFHYHYAEVQGDKDACSEYTLQLLNNKVIDFPSDNSLLTAASKELNNIIKAYYQKK